MDTEIGLFLTRFQRVHPRDAAGKINARPHAPAPTCRYVPSPGSGHSPGAIRLREAGVPRRSADPAEPRSEIGADV